MSTYRAPTDGADCNDAAPLVRPGAAEVCNGEDDDCDLAIDDGIATTTYYRDADGDTYGDAAMAMTDCRAPAGHTLMSGDCDDGNASRRPGLAELCDMLDNDCDAMIDEMAASGTWYR
ncbi:MAG: regulator of chromosome condensation, partial [Acidimicrobiaceae bacterium]